MEPFVNFYRPQRSWGKVIFSQVSVILSTGGGHAWPGACVTGGGMHGGGHAWQGGMRGGKCGGVRDWNAFLLQGVHAVKKVCKF